MQHISRPDPSLTPTCSSFHRRPDAGPHQPHSFPFEGGKQQLLSWKVTVPKVALCVLQRAHHQGG